MRLQWRWVIVALAAFEAIRWLSPKIGAAVLVIAMSLLVSLLLVGGGDPNHPDNNQRHGPF